ncbi:unnamed protein product, partial [Polarella glacialis]
VQRYLGEDLNKTFQVSNWNFRPLSAAQVIYAATDAHILLRVEAAMRLQNVLPQRVFGAAPRVGTQPAWWLTAGGPGDEASGRDPGDQEAEWQSKNNNALAHA